MPIYERGKVRIHYEEMGSGFPLLVIPGGGLNSTIAGLDTSHPFNAMKEFAKDGFRCIGADLRNANAGQSSGPLEVDRPWDSYTDDHIGLMDHLGIEKFMVLGYCIGQPFIWNLIKRAPNRVVAAVLTQPSGHRPELPDQFYQNNMNNWGPALVARRPDITIEQVSQFLAKMYRANPDFVFTVTPRLRARLPDPDPGAARRRPAASLCGGDGGGDAGAQFAGQHVSVEGHAGEDSAGGAAHPDVPEGQPAGDGGDGAAGGGGLNGVLLAVGLDAARPMSTVMSTVSVPTLCLRPPDAQAVASTGR